MKPKYFKTSIAIVVLVSLYCLAECPLDHFIIGVNQDGIEGTNDDRILFVDCSQKYRDSGTVEYSNWFYPLNESIFTTYRYRLGEPGFDSFQNYNSNAAYTYDPNRALSGWPNIDYKIIVQCVSMSQNLRVVHKDYPQFTIDKPGQNFNHSDIHELRGDSHMHLSYQAADGENLFWITYYLYDELADVNNPNDPNHYLPSKPFTIVFNKEPLKGDLVINNIVDQNDLVELSYYWLGNRANRDNDYYERADTNRDGIVNFIDFALFARNWLKTED